jgi:hypothetical protein
MRMHHIFYGILRRSHKRPDFREKGFEHKMCIDFLYKFCLKLFSFQELNSVRSKIFIDLQVKHPLFLLHFKESWSGFGGLEVACWPLVPKFAGSNPVEAVGFFRARKSSARLPSEGK